MSFNAGKSAKNIAIYSIVLILIILSWGACQSIDAAGNSRLYRHVDITHQKGDTVKILSTLESKIDDQKLLKKAMNKLPALEKKQLQLLTNLCERIKKEDTTESNIAFLLATLLIIFS